MISVPETLGYSVLGMTVVFLMLILLMLIIVIMGKSAKAPAKEAPKAAPQAPAAKAPEVKIPEAPGTCGSIDLHSVDPKTAAMIMAIVADEMGVPLNQLRFISIKED